MHMSDKNTPGSEESHAGRWKRGGPSPNPAGRPRKDEASASKARADGWQNVVTALGTRGDKRTYGQVRVDVVGDHQARDLWRGHDVCARAVELIPAEAMRRGIGVRVSGKGSRETDSGAIEQYLEKVPGPQHVGRGWVRVLKRALQYQRAYGGAGVMPVINDAQGSLEAPLNLAGVRKIERLRLFEPRELWPLRYYRDPLDERCGEVELWHVRPRVGVSTQAQYVVHESRILILPGVRVTAAHEPGANPGFGDSIYTRIWAPINDFESGYSNAAALLQDFAQAVIKLRDLATIAGSSPDAAEARLEFLNRARSTLNAILLDSEDSFSREQTPVSGYADLLDRLAQRVSMATGIPVTILLGQAPAGLNATGDADIRALYSLADSEREEVTPIVERLIELACICREGPTRGRVPEQFSPHWPALWSPTDKEIAETRAINMTHDVAGVGAGILTPSECRTRWNGDTYSNDLILDDAAWQAQADLESDFQDPAPAQLPPGAEVDDPETDVAAEDVEEEDAAA